MSQMYLIPLFFKTVLKLIQVIENLFLKLQNIFLQSGFLLLLMGPYLCHKMQPSETKALPKTS